MLVQELVLVPVLELALEAVQVLVLVLELVLELVLVEAQVRVLVLEPELVLGLVLEADTKLLYQFIKIMLNHGPTEIKKGFLSRHLPAIFSMTDKEIIWT